MLSVSLFPVLCRAFEVANYFTNRPYGSDPSEVKLIQMFAVDYDYLALYSPEMLCGRGFSEAYGNERNKVVLNEEAVRLLGYPSPEEALGKQLEMEVLEDPLEVVGVVKIIISSRLRNRISRSSFS